MFIIYMNDIINSSNLLRYVLYADDTSVFYSANDVITLLNTINAEMTKVCAWFEANHLLLNASKTSYIIFRRRKYLSPNISPLVISGNVINRVSSAKFLGVVVDDHVNFKAHVDYNLKKLSKYIFIIYKIRKFIPLKELIQIYYCLIYPNLIYCVSVWGSCYESTLKPLKTLQNRLVRAISGVGYRASAQPVYQRYKLLKLDQINKYMTGAYVFKSLNNELPSMFEFRDQTRYFTRESTMNLLTIPRVASAHSKQSIRVSGPTIFNGIPPCIRDSNSYNSFKLKYKHYLRLADQPHVT